LATDLPDPEVSQDAMKKVAVKLETKREVPREEPRRNPPGGETSGDRLDEAVRIDPKWQWHYLNLLEMRNLLSLAQREGFHEAAEPLEPASLGTADSATDEFDHDLSLSKLSRQQAELWEIEQAIRRILNGTYGICEVTGKPIAARRLRSVPWTRYSCKVEAELEREGMTPRPHVGKVGTIRGRRSENGEKGLYSAITGKIPPQA